MLALFVQDVQQKSVIQVFIAEFRKTLEYPRDAKIVMRGPY